MTVSGKNSKFSDFWLKNRVVYEILISEIYKKIPDGQ